MRREARLRLEARLEGKLRAARGHGGRRPGAGTKKGTRPYNKGLKNGKKHLDNDKVFELLQYREKGELPHEFLWRISRGEPIEGWYFDQKKKKHCRTTLHPTLDQRIDCAKAAAPYFAPRLSTIELLQGITDESLIAFIASVAAEAGFSLGTPGAGTQKESKPHQAGAARSVGGLLIDNATGAPVS